MFIKDSDLVDIKVYYKKRGYRYEVYTEEEFKVSELEEDKKASHEILCFKMQMLTWGLYNQLQEDAMVEDINGNPQFNIKRYKENRLQKLLREWDAKDSEGKPVPISAGAISHLSPDIAEGILRAYDELALIDEAEEGK